MAQFVGDFFGVSPKTVLNKPFMHVQDQKPQDTLGGASIAGVNYRTLNTILTNDILGASLSSNRVTLPAGTYYIDGHAPCFGGNRNRLTLRNIADNSILLTGSAHFAVTGSEINSLISGGLVLTTPTTIEIQHYITTAVATYGIGVGNCNGEGVEIFADLKIWRLDTNVETVVFSDPLMTLNKPFFHAQDQKAVGVAGGSSLLGVAGNDRDLNVVVTNEIAGASLSANQVTLPSGTYYIAGYATCYLTADGRVSLSLRDSLDNYLMRGRSNFSTGGLNLEVSGKITLLTTTTIKLNSVHGSGSVSNGLGVESSKDPYELYADLKIWQLDSLVQTPVIVADKLFPLPGSAMVTGNMHGFDYAWTSTSSITIQAGICMDSTNDPDQVPLSLSTQQVLTIPSVINTIYNLFICDDGVVRTDTDVDGAGLGAYRVRWIGFVRNNSSGILMGFIMKGNDLIFSMPSETLINSLTNVPLGCSTAVDISQWIPDPKRVSYVMIGGRGSNTSSNTTCVIGFDGTNAFTAITARNLYIADSDREAWGNIVNKWMPLKSNNIYWGEGSLTGTLLIQALFHGARLVR